MKSFELRFVERYQPVPELGENISWPIKILQYRDPLHGAARWQDVPFVPPEDEKPEGKP